MCKVTKVDRDPVYRVELSAVEVEALQLRLGTSCDKDYPREDLARAVEHMYSVFSMALKTP